MDHLFKTRTLTASVNEIKTTQTQIIDTIFGAKSMQPNSRFAWDVQLGSETIMKNIKAHETATVVQKTGRATVTCEAPRYAEKRFIGADEIQNIRALGQQTATMVMADRIGTEQRDMRNKIDRTREYLAANALAGQILDETGAVIVDFHFTGAQKPTLGAGFRWNEVGGDPLANLRAWQKMISQSVGVVSQWTAFCGFDAMTALMNNEKVLKLMQYQRGAQIAESGAIVDLAGVRINQYFGTYVDSLGVAHEFIPNDAFVLIGFVPGAFGEIYAPAVQQDAKGEMFFAKSWDTPDPSGKWILTETRPLPVVYRPACIVYADVV
jgi:hypothetical protein